jgi:hypothetical protein
LTISVVATISGSMSLSICSGRQAAFNWLRRRSVSGGCSSRSGRAAMPSLILCRISGSSTSSSSATTSLPRTALTSVLPGKIQSRLATWTVP